MEEKMDINKLDSFALLDGITDGFYLLDLDWTMIYINKAAEEMMGRKKEELIGKCIWEEIKDVTLYDHYHLTMEKQQHLNFEFYNPSTDKWFNIRTYPEPEWLSVFFIDITDDKKDSIKQDQYYQSLFTNNADAVATFDLEGNYTSMNKLSEDFAGYSKEGLLSINYKMTTIEEDKEKAIYFFNETLKGVPQTFECRALHKTGKIVPLEVTNIPISIGDEIVGVYGIAKDLTLQKMTEENVEKSEKLTLVGQLSVSIAHEIKNPLTTLKGFLQLVKETNEISPAHVDIMLSEMDRIEMITNEMLYLAKPQAVEFKFRSIKDVIDSVVMLLQSQALMKNIEIKFSYEDVSSIYCVMNQMKQVFINMVKNGIESMSQGGIIKINLLHVDKDYVLIEVIDQGCGISEELAPKIGLPFYSTKDKGTGLGMLTTYKIINDHGGSITFDSKIGEGTTFKVYLPKNPQEKNQKYDPK